MLPGMNGYRVCAALRDDGDLDADPDAHREGRRVRRGRGARHRRRRLPHQAVLLRRARRPAPRAAPPRRRASARRCSRRATCGFDPARGGRGAATTEVDADRARVLAAGVPPAPHAARSCRRPRSSTTCGTTTSTGDPNIVEVYVAAPAPQARPPVRPRRDRDRARRRLPAGGRRWLSAARRRRLGRCGSARRSPRSLGRRRRARRRRRSALRRLRSSASLTARLDDAAELARADELAARSSRGDARARDRRARRRVRAGRSTTARCVVVEPNVDGRRRRSPRSRRRTTVALGRVPVDGRAVPRGRRRRRRRRSTDGGRRARASRRRRGDARRRSPSARRRPAAPARARRRRRRRGGRRPGARARSRRSARRSTRSRRASSTGGCRAGDRDEIARLATTMNGMLDRLEAAQERQRRFVSDASHELRSPVAAIRQHAEVALAHPERHGRRRAGRRRCSTRTCGCSGSSTTCCCSPGSTRARRAATRAGRPRRPRARRGRAAAGDDGSRTSTPSGVGAAGSTATPTQLERIVRNLVDNAARHARPAVALGCATRDGRARCSPSTTTGPASPRPIASGSSSGSSGSTTRGPATDGGTGLGLAIVREVVEAHGGEVSFAESLRTAVRVCRRGSRPLLHGPAATAPLFSVESAPRDHHRPTESPCRSRRHAPCARRSSF